MAVTRNTATSARLTASLTALAAVGLLAIPNSALAQDGRRGGGNDEPRQAPARPAPAAAPAPAPRAYQPPAVAMERGGNWRAPAQWSGQPRPQGANPAGNPWQPRAAQAQPVYRGQPAYQGRQAFQGQPAYQGQRPDQQQFRGNGAWHNDDHQGRGRDQAYGGQWRGHDGGGERGRDGGHDGGQWRGRDGGEARGHDGGQWNHGWREDNRYDWRDYREANREEFHVGRYYAPYRGYSYNRLGIGFYLQPLFFGSDYWIADPWDYRLPPAYGPYHWVRYYDDVILVNVYNGQVADVIYDFFW